MRFIVVVLTFVALYIISVKLVDPKVFSDQHSLQYIQTPLSVILSQNASVLTAINSSITTLSSLTDANSAILAESAMLREQINGLGFNLKPAFEETPKDEDQVMIYAGLNKYIQDELEKIDKALPCHPLLTSVFDAMQDLENYRYNGELNTYMSSSVIDDLLSEIKDKKPYLIVQTSIYNIINTCVTIDIENAKEPEPI